jgi:DNA-binding transcriptional LysR family regulator
VDFNQLRTFLEVSRNKSFSKAADKLHLTQPSISAQVRSLEKSLGHRLFERGGGKVTLTAAGRVFEPYVEDCLSRHNHIKLVLDDLSRSPRGSLTVSANDSTALYVLPHLFSRFKKQHPRVALTVNRTERVRTVELVLNREVDFGVVSLPLTEPRLKTEIIHEDELVLIASPRHPLVTGTTVTLEAVSKHSLLLPVRSRRREMLDRLFSERNLIPRIGMELDSNELLKRLIMADAGIGFLPLVNVAAEVRSKQLVVLKVKDVHIPRKLALIWHKDRDLPVACQMFFKVATGSWLSESLLAYGLA